MKIEIIGSGCAKCKKLYELTKEVAQDLNIKENVEKAEAEEIKKRLEEAGATVELK